MSVRYALPGISGQMQFSQHVMLHTDNIAEDCREQYSPRADKRNSVFVQYNLSYVILNELLNWFLSVCIILSESFVTIGVYLGLRG